MTILVVSRGSRAKASSSLVMSVVSDIVGCIVVELGAVILLGASSGMSVTSVVSNTTTQQHDGINQVCVTKSTDNNRKHRAKLRVTLLAEQKTSHRGYSVSVVQTMLQTLA